MIEEAKKLLRENRDAAALCALWALELFIVQEYTLIPAAALSPGVHLLRSVLRLSLVTGACAVLVLALPPAILLVLFAIEFIFFVLAISYFDFFGSPLSLLQAWYNFGEGAGLGVKVMEMFNWSAFAALMVALTFKLWLAFRVKWEDADFRSRARRKGLLASFASLAAAIVVHAHSAPAGVDTFTQLGSSFGYVIAGTWELQYTRGEQLLARALEVRGKAEDVLGPIEHPFPVHDRFILMQVESLDWGILEYDYDGVPVMPFMRELSRKAARYRIESVHLHGSADADFMALSGDYPSIDVLNYKIPDYPYDHALPAFLRAYGYQTVALHGVSGDYFDRRPAYERMGFDQILFREELVARYGFEPVGWGVVDGDLFDASADLLSKSEGRVFHFLITVSSHGPFRPGRNADVVLTTDKDIDSRFFNTMRYVDNVIEEYVRALPPQTTLAFYGDHTSGVMRKGYESGRVGIREFVPFLLYNTGEDLAALQKTREGPYGEGGQLDLLQLLAFVRERISAQNTESRP